MAAQSRAPAPLQLAFIKGATLAELEELDAAMKARLRVLTKKVGGKHAS